MSVRNEESSDRREGRSDRKFYDNVYRKDAGRDENDNRREDRGERSPRSDRRSGEDRRGDRNDRSTGTGPRNDRFSGPRSDRSNTSGPRQDRFNSSGPRTGNGRSTGNDARSGGSGRPFSGDRRDDNRSFNRGGREDRREGGSTPRFNERRFEERDNRPKRQDNDRENRFGNERRFDERGGNDKRRPSDDRFNRRDDRNDNPRFNREDRSGSRGDRSNPSGPRDNRRDDRRNSNGDRFNEPRRKSFGWNDRPERDTNRSQDDRFNRRDDRNDKPRFKPAGQDDATNERLRRQIEDSQSRQVGRSRAPEYDVERMKAKVPANKKAAQKRERSATDEPRKPKEDSDTVRLNRYIANSGICSRRDADALIANGDISVNGNVVTEMGYKVRPTDVIKYGNRVLNPEKMIYVLLNKPKDYITTTEDPDDRRTVMELVAGATPYRIYPVGRLDRNTTGLLLLTNDGELAEKLTHPSNEIRKIYQAELDKPITEEHFEAIQKGVELEDGFIKPDDLGLVTPDAQVIGIEIHSGRNRIVRRIFEHFDYEVTKLDRTSYAGLTKKDLPRGSWRYLDEKEVIRLKFLL